MNPLRTAWSGLRRNALSGLAIVALVGFSGALTIVASAEERAFRQASTRASDRFDLLIGAAGDPLRLVMTTIYLQPAALDLLPASTLASLSDDPRVERLAPVAVTDSWRGYPVVATSVSFAIEPGIVEGHAPTAATEALVGDDVNVAVTTQFAPQHGSPGANRFETHEHAMRLTIVGRVARTGTPWDRAIIIPIEAAWMLHDEVVRVDHLGPPWPLARVPAIVVHPRNVSAAYALRAAYRGDGRSAQFPAEVLLPLYRVLGDTRDLVTAMALAFAGMLMIAVTLAIVIMLAGQRKRMGTLRALGAPARFVFAVWWLQAVTLIGAGSVLAVAAGALLLRVASSVLSERTGLAVHAVLSTTELLLIVMPLASGALACAIVVGVLSRAPVAALLRGE